MGSAAFFAFYSLLYSRVFSRVSLSPGPGPYTDVDARALRSIHLADAAGGEIHPIQVHARCKGKSKRAYKRVRGSEGAYLKE